jgi:hypothetical protein
LSKRLTIQARHHKNRTRCYTRIHNSLAWFHTIHTGYNIRLVGTCQQWHHIRQLSKRVTIQACHKNRTRCYTRIHNTLAWFHTIHTGYNIRLVGICQQWHHIRQLSSVARWRARWWAL